MELLPYKKFSALHIKQFFPPKEIYEDDTGMEQTLLGFNRCRHYFDACCGQAGFFYPSTPPRVLAAISLSTEHLAPEVAQPILTACAYPVPYCVC